MATSVVQNDTGIASIDGLLANSRWSGTITYSFPQLATQYPAQNELATFAPISQQQQEAIDAILRGTPTPGTTTVMTATNVNSFIAPLVSFSGDNGAGDIRVGQSNRANPTAYAYYPNNNANGNGGDVWFGTANNYTNPHHGDYAYLTHIHELGHALGLKHPHELAAPGGTSPALPLNIDGLEFTVMSYRDYVGDSTSDGYATANGNFPQTFMQYDIQALQAMYGAYYGSNSGNTEYTWDPATGQMFIDGVGQGTPFSNVVFLTIWDGNGVDTYDMSNYSGGVEINLEPGLWSVTSPTQVAQLEDGQAAHGTVYNSFLFNGDLRSIIENAIGGSGNDTLTGNQVANTLTGGNGNDTLDGGLGLDTLRGGLHNDTFVLANGTDTVSDAGGIDTITSTIARSLISYPTIENLILLGTGAIAGIGNALNNVITGNGAANLLNGGNGNDSLDGGLGLDSLFGGLGNDIFVLENGTDTVSELGGIDTITSTIARSLISYPTIENLTLLGTSAIAGIGNALNNVIRGNAAANLLNGGVGNDTLNGELGNDVLIGSVGKDTLIGNGNGDRFDFNALAESVVGANRDLIQDFNRVQGDKIDLSTIDADTDGTAGNQAFSFIGAGAFTGVDGQLRCSAGIIQGDVNGDRVADFEIHSNLATHIASDFIL